jgi:hypothetical protein
LNQLGREWLEFGHIALRLLSTDRATLVIHERTAGDRPRVIRQMESLCGQAFTDDHADIPTACFACGGGDLEKRKRYDWDPNSWLYCPRCKTFLAGFGDYNFIRDPHSEPVEEWKPRQDLEPLIAQMRPWLGERMLQFFLDDGHLRDGAEEAMLSILRTDADRYLKVPLDDILYPY